MIKSKEVEGDKLMKKAMNYCKPSIFELRMKPNWNSAAPLYEQAANVYKSGNSPAKARIAYERVAECQEHLGSSWHAGKMLEKAAEIAKEQNEFQKVADLYTQAAQAYFEAGRAQTSSESYFKAARALEQDRPEQSSELYKAAFEALEHDERFSFGPDLYRSAVTHELKRERFDVAVSLLMKYASVSEERGLDMSVARSYLGAIVVLLYAQNAVEAESVFNDSSAVETFRGSSEYSAAAALLDAYRSGGEDDIKKLIRDRGAFQSLDTVVGRLANRLPTGDLKTISASIQLSTVEIEDDLT